MTELTTKIKSKEDIPENWANASEQYQKDTEILTQAIDQLSVVKDDTEEFVDTAMTTTAAIANEPFRPRNRAERRALDKATRRQKQKKRRMFADSIKETAEKLAYINMIEKVRALNEQIKAEGEKENEAANEGNSNV